MKNMQWKTGLLLAGLVMSSLLTGCGEKETTKKAEVKAEPKADVSLKATAKTLKSVAGSVVEPFNGGMKVTSTFTKMPAYHGATQGARFRLDRKMEAKLSGKTVVIKIIAAPVEKGVIRQGDNDDLPHHFAVSYSTAAVGASGWKKFPVSLEKSKYRFEYKIKQDPKLGTRSLTDYIGILSDADGKGRPIVIDRIDINIQ